MCVCSLSIGAGFEANVQCVNEALLCSVIIFESPLDFLVDVWTCAATCLKEAMLIPLG